VLEEMTRARMKLRWGIFPRRVKGSHRSTVAKARSLLRGRRAVILADPWRAHQPPGARNVPSGPPRVEVCQPYARPRRARRAVEIDGVALLPLPQLSPRFRLEEAIRNSGFHFGVEGIGDGERQQVAVYLVAA
jgi:hypothetical protein